MSTPNLHSLPDEETAGGICFVGEQDGFAEGELKRKLADLFRAGIGVRKAYLVRVIYKENSKGSGVVELPLARDPARIG
jgi:hypothetical protein